MAICERCGQENREGSAFCMNCGSPLQGPPPSDREGPLPPLPLEPYRPVRRWALMAVAIVLPVLLAGVALFTVLASRGEEGGGPYKEARSEAMFRADPARTGAFPGPGPSGLQGIRWNFKTDGDVFSSPAVCGGVVYCGSHDDHLYALDAEGGEELWRFKTGGWVSSSPAVCDGVVYFGSDDGCVYALDAESGEERWRFKTGYSVTSSPAVCGGVVYCGSWDDYIYALH